MDDTGHLVPEGLLEAFGDYEDALMANDLDTLDALFAPGAGTMRGDANGLLVGHEQISAFRGIRGGVSRRTIVRTEVRVLDDDTALIVSVSRFAVGGAGLQTQLWQRTDAGGWAIGAAHVTGRPQAFDKAVWRMLGDPLVAGAADGPLAGRTVAVKDLFDVAGFAVGAGVPAWLAEAQPATVTAPAVQALLDAGASVLGIARTDEFAYSIAGQNAHYGTPANAVVPGALPGGSSSGPASAVASGQADIGLATDTAGSIRVPASYQGLWGLRTTHGAVDRGGLLPLAQSFDTVGWLTRDAATLRGAAAASLPTGRELPELPEVVVWPAVLAAVSPETRAAFDAYTDGLVARGLVASLGELEPPALDDLFDTFRAVQGAEAWRNDGAFVDAHPDALGPDIAARFAIAAAVTPEAEASARVRLSQLRADIRGILGDRVLLLPTAPGPAPLRTAPPAEIEAVRAATLRMTALAGIGGLPALSVPALEVGGAPVGLCLVGPVGSDLALLDLAASWLD